jgi:hypothetical protein
VAAIPADDRFVIPGPATAPLPLGTHGQVFTLRNPGLIGAVKGTVNTMTTETLATPNATVRWSPAHAAGTLDVTVTTTGGTSATSAAEQFTFVAASSCASGCVSVGDKAMLEGDSVNHGLSFKVTLSQRATTTVTVDYTVTLSNVTGGYGIGRGIATGTILNDDGVASGITLGVGDGSIVVQHSGNQSRTGTLVGPP